MNKVNRTKLDILKHSFSKTPVTVQGYAKVNVKGRLLVNFTGNVKVREATVKGSVKALLDLQI